MRRTLSVLSAVVALVAAAAPAALADTASLRVEIPTQPSGLVPRTAVDLSTLQDVTKSITPTTDQGTTTKVTCSAGSAISVLDAVTKGNWAPTASTTSATDLGVARIMTGVDVAKATAPAPAWVVYVGGHLDQHPCTDTVHKDQEALFYPQCAAGVTKSAACFTDGPLFILMEGDRFFDPGPASVPFGAPIKVFGYSAPLGGTFPTPTTATAFFKTDEGLQVATDDKSGDGHAFLRIDVEGPHLITLNQSGHVPDRLPICASNGADGYCGTSLPPPGTIDTSGSAPCTTNGHDGFCGTTDTSGPVTHVTNITNGQVFAHKHGPTGFKGTIETDPNGVKGVHLRITRVVKVRVAIKPKKKTRKKSKKKASSNRKAKSSAVAAATKKHTSKKKKKKKKVRYRTVRRCSFWSDDTLLLESMKHCGTKYGKWFDADVDDIPTAFHYDFAMKLPPGTYTLETQSEDYLGGLDPPEAGRNIITFVVR